MRPGPAETLEELLAAWWPRPRAPHPLPAFYCPSCGRADVVLIRATDGAVHCPECR